MTPPHDQAPDSVPRAGLMYGALRRAARCRADDLPYPACSDRSLFAPGCSAQRPGDVSLLPAHRPSLPEPTFRLTNTGVSVNLTQMDNQVCKTSVSKQII